MLEASIQFSGSADGDMRKGCLKHFVCHTLLWECLQAVIDMAAVSSFFSECASLRHAGGSAGARSAGRRMAAQGAYSGAQAKPPLMHTPGLTSGPSPPPSGHYTSLQVRLKSIFLIRPPRTSASELPMPSIWQCTQHAASPCLHVNRSLVCLHHAPHQASAEALLPQVARLG